MGGAHKGFPCKGVIVGWRRDRGHGQITDSISRRHYLAALAGNVWPSLEPGVDLVGKKVRYSVQSPHLPVKWILEEYAEPEGEALSTSESPELPSLRSDAAVCNSAYAAVPPVIASVTQVPVRSARQETATEHVCSARVDFFTDTGADHDLLARIARLYDLKPEEAVELLSLVREMRALGFTYSDQLSRHIMKNRLASKYPNISGIVRMEQAGRQWDFRGGFPPRIYGLVCRVLDLKDKGSGALPVDFTSFKELSAAREAGQRQTGAKAPIRSAPHRLRPSSCIPFTIALK